MATTPYRPVSWSDNEPVFTSKLNQMTSNDQWLFENSATMLFDAYGVNRAQGIKMACGVLTCAPSPSGIQQHTVYFPAFFTNGCNPVLVTELVHQGEVRFHWGTKGIGTRFPDHRGFEILGGSDVTGGWTRMTKTFYIPWIAMGY